MCGSESVVQATNNALMASAASPAGYLVVMEPPRYWPLGVRVAIQMSVPPNPPDRLEAKSSVRPSPDRLGCWSDAAELSGLPRFTGVDHGS